MAHDHAHVHEMTANGGEEHQKRLMLSLGLTATVFLAEVVSAVITGSLALLVDAGHTEDSEIFSRYLRKDMGSPEKL